MPDLNPYRPPSSASLERPRRKPANSLSEDVRFWLLIGPPFLSQVLAVLLFDFPYAEQFVFGHGVHAFAMLVIWTATFVVYYRQRRQVGGQFLAWLSLTYLLTIAICWCIAAVSVISQTFTL